MIFYDFLWTSVYSGEVSIEGISWGQMIVYLMGKSMNICGYWFSSDIGNVIRQLISYFLSIIGLVAFIFVA